MEKTGKDNIKLWKHQLLRAFNNLISGEQNQVSMNISWNANLENYLPNLSG